MDKGRHGRGARRPLAGGSLFSRFIAAGGGRLRDVDRIGGGKAVLEALFERPLEPAFADFFPVALGLVVEFLLHDGSLRNCHGCSPCERRTGRAIVQITRGVWLVFPYQGSGTSNQGSSSTLFPDYRPLITGN